MKEVKASEFKARCLQLMDEVAKTLFGVSQEIIVIKGDIVSPIDVVWEVAE